MRNNILAQSLQKSLDKSAAASKAETEVPSPIVDGPKSLRSMADVLSSVAAQAPQEIDVAEIADSEVADRFDVQDGLSDLIESIRSSGQQFPVLLRHRRGAGPRYEVVYGRRRIAACRALGLRVNAYVKEMSLEEALMSQALENSARLERSFIEQAVFAEKLETAGFSTERICQALAIDSSTLSRLRAVVRDVPKAVIFRIGAAQGVGRRPWMELRELLKDAGQDAIAQLVSLIPEQASAAEKLESAIKALSSPVLSGEVVSTRPRATQDKTSVAGSISYRASNGSLVLKADRKQDRAFLEYVEARLAELYDDWSKDHASKSRN